MLRAARDKRSLSSRGRNRRLAADLSTANWQARKHGHGPNPLRLFQENKTQPSRHDPARLSFRPEGEMQSFRDTQKQKASVITHPALQDILKGLLQGKGKPPKPSTSERNRHNRQKQ